MNWRIITLSAVDCVVPLNNYSAQKLNGVLFYPKVQVEITTTHPSNSYPVSVQYMFSFFLSLFWSFFFMHNRHAASCRGRRLHCMPSEEQVHGRSIIISCRKIEPRVRAGFGFISIGRSGVSRTGLLSGLY
jgi:hypothetical protein